MHAHRWRHTFAHEWKVAGGDTGDLMLVLGWASQDMARHYGASASGERALKRRMPGPRRAARPWQSAEPFEDSADWGPDPPRCSVLRAD